MAKGLIKREISEIDRKSRNLQILLKIILYISIVCTLISGYILFIQFYGFPSHCRLGPVCDCDIVINSGHSKIIGIPVALLGIEGCVVIIAAAMILLQRMDRKQYPGHRPMRLHLLIMLLMLAGFIHGTYFTYVQAYGLQTWCILHILLYVMTIIMLVLSVYCYIWRRQLTRGR